MVRYLFYTIGDLTYPSPLVYITWWNIRLKLAIYLSPAFRWPPCTIPYKTGSYRVSQNDNLCAKFSQVAIIKLRHKFAWLLELHFITKVILIKPWNFLNTHHDQYFKTTVGTYVKDATLTSTSAFQNLLSSKTHR